MAYAKNKYKIFVDQNSVLCKEILKVLFAEGFVLTEEHRIRDIAEANTAFYFSMRQWRYLLIGENKECKRVITPIKEGFQFTVRNFSGYKRINVNDLVKLDLLK